MSRRALRFLLLSIVAFVIGLFAARALLEPSTPPKLQQATWLPGGRPLPRLDLLDQDGRPFDGTSFTGRWTLVFFGFTSCPDVCPTTLATLAGVARRLADRPVGERPAVLLISVDPERDRPEMLGSYVRAFDPAFQAATGTAEGVAAAARAFGVGYVRVSRPDGSYSVDHGSSVLVVDPRGRIVAVSPYPQEPEALAADYLAIVDAHQ
ncbi:MAG: SCO family protein [Gammaproteobacteria bacterium]|jgi:protein SCO1/2|nr:SCO family protein [Gammaproteobacteria bacterium]